MITANDQINPSYETPEKSISATSAAASPVLVICSSVSSREEETENEVVGPKYIENKIKILLNQKQDEEEHSSPTARLLEDLKTSTCDSASDNERRKETTVLGNVFIIEDSCNAVDHKLSNESKKTEFDDLSFNGKINSIKASTSTVQCELSDATLGFETSTAEKTMREKLSEPFEILAKEDTQLFKTTSFLDILSENRTTGAEWALSHMPKGCSSMYENERSPDLFVDDDDEDEEEEEKVDEIVSILNQSVDENEKALLKRLQTSLLGVLPPPSVTISSIDIRKMLALYKENESKFSYRNNNEAIKMDKDEDDEDEEFLCKPLHTTDEIMKMDFPDLLKTRAHGLCFNKSTTTEKIELLGLKYIERYIGAETSSSFNMSFSPSSTKKRNQKLKLLNQSPGSRLSHLAKRRAAFSSANLFNNTSKLCNRQILIDNPKKSENRRKNKIKTPKRRTPGRKKTPRQKTPKSSQKKKNLSLAIKPIPLSATRETSKRALFQSPAKDTLQRPQTTTTTSEVQKSAALKFKRVLFSPAKRLNRFSSFSSDNHEDRNEQSLSSSLHFSSLNNIDKYSFGSQALNMKRKRTADDEENFSNAEKLARLDSINEEDLTPRSLKFARSQSFCVGSISNSSKINLEPLLAGKALFRANSEVTFPNSSHRPVNQLTENHKKKLLWAVSQALQAKQITVKHSSFKEVASNLARLVKRLFLEFNDLSVTSTSEKLLKLANKHVFDVIQGKTVDEMYLKEKTRLMNVKNISKLSGYIAPEEYEMRKTLIRKTSSSLFASSENSSDSFSFSQSQRMSQSTEFLIQTNNSTSKNNENCTILRENIDNEQRQKSGQKQVSFSGKDQKNVSPYTRGKILVGSATKNSSILKAKRQISFE